MSEKIFIHVIIIIAIFPFKYIFATCTIGLLESNQNLLFMLKCRQFVEMVNGSDLEVRKASQKKFSFEVMRLTFSAIISNICHSIHKILSDGRKRSKFQ